MEFLKKKYGPLPAWGWGVIGIAAIVFCLRYRAANAAAAGSTTTASVPFGSSTSATAPSNGYGPSLSDQIGTLTGDVAALQGLNTALGLGPTGSGSPTASSNPPLPTTTYPTAGQFLGLDGLVYDASTFWWVNGIPYPKWQFSAPPPPGSAGSVGFAIPPQGWPFAPVPGGQPQSQPLNSPTNASGGMLSGGNPAPVQPSQGVQSLGFPGVQGVIPSGYPHTPGVGG